MDYNIPTQVHDAHSAGSSTEPSEFVNHEGYLIKKTLQQAQAGLLLWNQGRQKWKGQRKADNRSQQLRARKLRTWCHCVVKKFSRCSYATYDGCLRSNKPLPKPIPLAEIVAFLVEVWEPGGGYD